MSIEQTVGLENAVEVEISERPVVFLFEGKRLMWFQFAECFEKTKEGKDILRLDGFSPFETSIKQDDPVSVVESEKQFPWTTISMVIP